jgi:hypothetical protein
MENNNLLIIMGDSADSEEYLVQTYAFSLITQIKAHDRNSIEVTSLDNKEKISTILPLSQFRNCVVLEAIGPNFDPKEDAFVLKGMLRSEDGFVTIGAVDDIIQDELRNSIIHLYESTNHRNLAQK